MGIWTKTASGWVEIQGGGISGSAVVASQNGGSVQSGVIVDGQTYDIYTFTQETTVASVKLTDEARDRITDPAIKAAIESGASVEDLLAEHGDVLKDALVIIPVSDPGLSMTFSSPGLVDLLVVGGGAGTFPNSGGGGAGGVLTVRGAFAPETAAITVGSGGSGTIGSAGGSGFSSHFGPYYAAGGGAPLDRKLVNSQGGSGAGGSYGDWPGTFGIDGLGHDGGVGGPNGNPNFSSGGGGGSTEPGQTGADGNGGNGGNGQDISSFLGEAPGTTVVGGGGGGFGNIAGGQGGLGGGGNGNHTYPAIDCEANTGGGAGSPDVGGLNIGASGGSGLVIVRVRV